jgi:hypothetical protein
MDELSALNQTLKNLIEAGNGNPSKTHLNEF